MYIYILFKNLSVCFLFDFHLCRWLLALHGFRNHASILYEFLCACDKCLNDIWLCVLFVHVCMSPVAFRHARRGLLPAVLPSFAFTEVAFQTLLCGFRHCRLPCFGCMYVGKDVALVVFLQYWQLLPFPVLPVTIKPAAILWMTKCKRNVSKLCQCVKLKIVRIVKFIKYNVHAHAIYKC